MLFLHRKKEDEHSAARSEHVVFGLRRYEIGIDSDEEPVSSSKKCNKGKGVSLAPLRPLLLRVSEACNLLGISRSTLYRLIAGGQIRTKRIGRGLRVPVSEVERFSSSDL